MTVEAIALLEGKQQSITDNNNPDFQFETLGGMGEEISLRVLTAEPSNERLMPFLEWLRNQSSIKAKKE